MPPAIGQKLVDKKGTRKYTKGRKRDIHEADLNHLQNAADAYKYIAKKFKWDVIECAEDNKVFSRGEIHKKLWKITSELL